MATIRIADAIHPIKLNDGTSSALTGGVFPVRNPSLDLRGTRSRSVERRGVRLDDHEGYGDEGLRQEGDFKKKQVLLGVDPPLYPVLTSK